MILWYVFSSAEAHALEYQGLAAFSHSHIFFCTSSAESAHTPGVGAGTRLGIAGTG